MGSFVILVCTSKHIGREAVQLMSESLNEAFDPDTDTSCGYFERFKDEAITQKESFELQRRMTGLALVAQGVESLFPDKGLDHCPNQL